MNELTAKERTKAKQNIFREKWYFFTLAGIAALSFFLNFFLIGQLGYGNAYYAAAIKSMTQSWHNFFYISFDPAGLVSVDKPPLGLWVQALFVMVFGYHGWAMLLPQALAGAGSSIMMYVLTAKRFGKPAGLISALVFAVTPAVVVASRNNTMDMQLIFVLLVAAWFLFRSIETGKWRWLFLCGVMIGIGFNVKMLQAYMIIPAVVLVYLLCAKEKLGKRFLAGVISVVVMAAVSFAWTAAVDLTPASQRPYVGSSTNNTELELIVGHNGMERVSGGMGGMNRGGGGMGGMNRGGGGMGGMNRSDGKGSFRHDGQNGTLPTTPNQNGQNNNNRTSPTMPNQGGNGGSGSNNGVFPGNPGGGFNIEGMAGRRTGGAVGNDIGTAGPFRLWQQNMYGQASWLLIPALFCILACLRKPRKKEQLTPKQGVFLFWVMWLAVIAGFFSFASFYHRYYLCMLAPGIAGVVGIGFPQMLLEFRSRKGWKQWLLPAMTAVSAGFSAWYVWVYYTALRTTLFPVIVIAGAAALLLMAAYLVRPKKLFSTLAAVLTGVSLLAGSFYWSLTATMYVCENVTMPYAGPELATTRTTPGMTANQGTFVQNDSATQALEDYLVKNYKTGSYLVVGQRANDVAQFIVDTGLPAVAYGGFLGTDKSLTLDEFKKQVQEGKITYVLISSQGGMGGDSSSSEISSYVKSNAALIAPTEYGGSSSNGKTGSLYYFGSGKSSSSSSSSESNSSSGTDSQQENQSNSVVTV